jgi:hypothetical protein
MRFAEERGEVTPITALPEPIAECPNKSAFARLIARPGLIEQLPSERRVARVDEVEHFTP